MLMWTVQDGSKQCVCSERSECLQCLERTAAHTLLSFSNTDVVRRTSFAAFSQAQFEPHAVQSCEVERPGSRSVVVEASCESLCRDGTAVDDSGLTPQMKRSRLAQVGECMLSMFCLLMYVDEGVFFGLFLNQLFSVWISTKLTDLQLVANHDILMKALHCSHVLMIYNFSPKSNSERSMAIFANCSEVKLLISYKIALLAATDRHVRTGVQ